MTDTADLSFMGGDDDFIDLDFTGVKALDFNPAPDGNYALVIVEAETGKSSVKQTPFLNVKMEIQGSCDKNPSALQATATGKLVWHKMYITEKSKPGNKPFFDALAGGNQDGPMRFKPNQLVGMRLGAILGTESYNKKIEKEGEEDTVETRHKNLCKGFFPLANL